MRLLVATEFSHDAPGGGPAVVRQMLSDANRRGAEIFWWSVRGPGNGSSDFRVTQWFAPPFPGKLYPTRRWTRAKAMILERLWAPLASRHLCRTIEQIRPDCIWAIPHNWSIPALHPALVGAGQRRTRLHTTIQDYPDVHSHPRLWGGERCGRFCRMQDEIYARADSRDATSLPMLDDLCARTGASGSQMLHQGLEQEDFAWLERSTVGHRPSAALKIAYAGTILAMPEFSVFVRVLAEVRKRVPLELHLFGAHSYASVNWFDPGWIFEHGNLSERDLVKTLRSCDWGFIPMSLQETDPRYNRFSFPTKFITYLAAGLPVIAMGHPESSVMKMASSYQLGINMTSLPGQGNDLAQLLEDPLLRCRANAEILRCAREYFDAGKMRGKLWDDLERGKLGPGA